MAALVHHALIHAIHHVMGRLHHQVALGAQVGALVPAEVDVPVHVVVVVLRGVQVHAEAVAPVLVAAVVQLDVKVLAEQGALLVARENVPTLVAQDAHLVAPDNVAVAVPLAALTDVKRHAPATVLMVVILCAEVDANIPAEELVNMFLQDPRAPVAQEPVVPIVIALVVWRAVPAVCLVVYPHLNDLESDKRTRSRLAIRQSQKYYLHRNQRLSVGM